MAVRPRRAVAIVATIAVLLTGSIVGGTAESAFAKDYPSWADVQAAKASVAAKAAEITRIEGLLAGLEASVSTAQAEAIKRGNEFQAAQQDLDTAAYRSAALKKQADAANASAESSRRKASQLAAQQLRAGGDDLTTTIFFSGDNASNLLSGLGLASQVKDQSAGLYDKAVQQRNSAQSLTDKAEVARRALQGLKDAAAAALDQANAASAKAAAALGDQEQNKARLEAQRETLVQNSTTAEADYNAGVQAAIALAAAQAAAARAAAAAAAAAAGQSNGGTTTAGTGGNVSASGWVRPSAGRISSPYGMRVNPVTGIYSLHAGTDLAPGCNAPIVAAHSGTVVFAGWSGGYGNFILINNGDGVLTGYGHIVNGGTLVGVGQAVGAGQQIARVGSTGNSTGCHLHFEVRPGGVAVDAVPYLRARGVNLAG